MKAKHIIVLIVIYVSFIALGLPDALLSSSWNLVREELDMPIGAIGLVTLVAYILTIFSTYFAPNLLSKFQTKHVTFFSILMTGVALLFISRTTAFYQIVLLAIPLGAGAGAIDLSLNHYIAVHYKASHMSYLHSFWGLGVAFGPMIMAATLQNNSWRLGYVYASLLLLLIAFIVLLSSTSWDNETEELRQEHHGKHSIKEILREKGVLHSLAIVLFYVHVESLLGVFIATYAFESLGVSYADAALFTMTYFLALTAGRILNGIATNVFHPNTLIAVGELMMLLGGILLLLPNQTMVFYMLMVALIGLGSGPIFPNMMYMNPKNFSAGKMSRIMSLQMVIGYVGFGAITPLIGLIMGWTSTNIYPFIIIAMSLVLLLITFRFFQFQLHDQTKKAT